MDTEPHRTSRTAHEAFSGSSVQVGDLVKIRLGGPSGRFRWHKVVSMHGNSISLIPARCALIRQAIRRIGQWWRTWWPFALLPSLFLILIVLDGVGLLQEG